ncbi:MAG: DUF885 domain-containing protein [Acidimicrobiales bacterium]
MTTAEAFERDVTAFLEEQLAAEPTNASFAGRTEWDHVLPDTTAGGFEHREARAREWRRHFGDVDEAALDPEQRVDLALLRAHLGQTVETSSFARWRRDATVYLENGVFELFVHRNRDEADATEAAVSRLRQVPEQLAAGRENLDPDLADPELVRRWAVPNAGAQASFAREGLADLVTEPSRRRALETAGAEAAAAYEGYGEFLESLAARARGSFVFGEDRYNAVLQIGEGFAFDARTLREMGRAQVEELDQGMTALAQETWSSPDWRGVVATLRDDHPASMEDMLRRYRDETVRAREFIRRRGLMTIPDGEVCAVEPAPLFLRASAPVASYFPPPAFGPSGRGTFNVPFTLDSVTAEEQEARLRSNSTFEIPGVTAHEAYPGHHLHYAVAQGTNALRQVLQSTYMVEGWGLYVEQMMGQQGFYENPAARMGQLSMRLFRAGRIVVDTSLHLGEMGIEEATEFMSERCGFPRPTAAGEVLRYCSFPTQASAYLTGALVIESMAEEWVGAGRGDLAAFHDALASSGKLPLGVAATAIGLARRPA